MESVLGSSVSEYRCNSESSEPKSSSNNIVAPSTKSYAHVTQNVFFPKKDQAVLLDAIDEVSIKDYIFAIGNMVNPRNIRFASRISNNRVCLYLANKLMADSLTKANTKVNIKGHELQIRPLIMESKRIILSNVCPIIPHDVIVDKLKSLSINCTSAVSFIKAGISEPGFSHILSFRRQVFISPDDVSKLPDSIQINYDHTNYWIYISTDNPICFLCKKEGHIAKTCSQSTPHGNVASNQIQPEDTTGSDTIVHVPTVPVVATDKSHQKRALATSSSNSSDPSFLVPATVDSHSAECGTSKPVQPVRENFKPLKKKRKQEPLKSSADLGSVKDMLSPIKDILTQHPDIYVIGYEALVDFLHQAVGNPNIPQLANQYTSDFPSFAKMLRELYPSLIDRSIKNRFSRIIKKLENHRNWSDDYSSDPDFDRSSLSMDHPPMPTAQPESSQSSASQPLQSSIDGD